MNQNIQDTLFQLCNQIIKDPETLPDIPIGIYPEEAHERRLLSSFRQMLEALRQSRQDALSSKEAQYLSIFEATADALFIHTLDGLVVEVNPAACTMYGYTRDQFIGMHPFDLLHPDSRSTVLKAMGTVKTGGQGYARVQALGKDGRLFHTEAHITRFLYKGRPHLLTTVRDVTEQVKTEEQLREKEAQYRSIFDATSDALMVNDLEGFVIEANSATCKLLGYSRQEFAGMHYTAFIPPELHSFVVKYLRKVLLGKQLQTTTIGIRKDGSAFDVETQGTPFTYQGQLHILSAFRDITERKQAEQQLREKEEQYRSIFEASSDGLVINDLEDGHLVEVNPAMCRMHGYTCEEFISLHPTSFIHPDSLPIFAEYIETVKAGREFQATAVDIRKDGTPFPVEVHSTTFTHKGKPHVLAVVRDITEQEQAYQLLEQRVEERTHELSTLLEVSHHVAATIELRPLVGLILEKLKEIVNYGGAGLATLEDNEFVFMDYMGPLPAEQVTQMRLLFKHSQAHQQVLSSGEPLIITDVYDGSPLAQALRQASRQYLGEAAADYMHSWMGIPLKSKERVIGLLSLSHPQSNFYTPQHARMAMALASQAAVAIENARLYEQAQDLAAIQERQRLARELHDSVSQALYGISLGTHTARTLLDRDPGKVAKPLDYVLSLADAALVEMRALIFELRPESLEVEGLVTALGKQAAALQARDDIEVFAQLGEEPDVPLKVKKELHRVAQEALHNTVKHAQASKVELRLDSTSEGIFLEIRDNGIGFDPQASFPGHLGLHSMRERITGLGGILQLESSPGQGTCISAWLSLESIEKRRTGMLG